MNQYRKKRMVGPADLGRTVQGRIGGKDEVYVIKDGPHARYDVYVLPSGAEPEPRMTNRYATFTVDNQRHLRSEIEQRVDTPVELRVARKRDHFRVDWK